MGAGEINAFLKRVAVEGKVAASTQNQALSALLFLFRAVLKSEVQFNAVRVKKSKRTPVVLSVDEVRRVLAANPAGPYRSMAGLMYGAGLRLMEVCRLRIKEIDFEYRQIVVRDGQGSESRMVHLPQKLVSDLREQREFVRRQHVADVEQEVGQVRFPYAM